MSKNLKLRSFECFHSRPRFSSKSRDSSVSRTENYLRGRSSQSEKIITGPSGDHDYSQPNTSSPISSAFMVSDRDFDPVNLNPVSRERSGRETPEEIQLGFDSKIF